MTKQELDGFRERALGASLRLISDQRLAALSPQQEDSEPIRFVLRAAPGLENAPQAKAALLRAAAKWENVLRSRDNEVAVEMEVEVDVDFDSTLFGEPFPAPDTLVVTEVGESRGLTGFNQGPNFANRVSTLQQGTVYLLLPYPYPTNLGETSNYRRTTPQSHTFGIDTKFYGLPSHRISLNSNIKFDFDPSDGIDYDKIDFEAAVLREMGRIFGFVSDAGEREFKLREAAPSSTNATIALSQWDFFRFRPGETMATITNGIRQQLSGGEQSYFTGDLDLPLSTAQPDGRGGDGRPAGHWKDDELTGRYIGIMDPTLAFGERGGITANDLATLGYFLYRPVTDATVMEVPSVDDNSREASLPLNGAMVVNRLTPAQSPFTLQSVRVHLPQPGNGSPVGAQLRLVAFADPARTGQPPANPQFLVDRTITIPNLPANRMLEVMIPNGPTVNGGDLYVGIQSSSANVQIAADSIGKQHRRSFISANNGASFQLLQSNNAPVNFMTRAVVLTKFGAGNNLTPQAESLSPSSAAPGSGEVTVFVQGNDFFPDLTDGTGFEYNSVVKWNGDFRPTLFLSKKLLQVKIPASDLNKAGTAQVTVFTAGRDGGRESAPLEFKIAPEVPIPSLASIDPPIGAIGRSALTLKVTGRDFKSNSVVRWNGSNRQTTFVSSLELRAVIPASDFTSASNAQVTVFAPGTGGGASNPLSFRVASCSYSISPPVLAYGRSPRLYDYDGVLLTTEDHCPWTIQSNVPWVTLYRQPASGMGNFPISFQIENNTSSTARTGTVTIGGQTLTIHQTNVGLTGVSSASFKNVSTAGAITTIFSAGMAKSTQSATTQPLPTNLAGTTVKILSPTGEFLAPLFFVSPTQINLLIPDEVLVPPPGDLTNFSAPAVSVYVDDTLVAQSAIRLESIAPGFFSSNASGQGLATGVALRVKLDGTQIYEPIAVYDQAQNKFVARPIDFGADTDQVFLILFGTGFRRVSSLNELAAKIGGLEVPVLYAGAQGDFAGLDQLNVELPRSLKGKGESIINCTFDGKAANLVTVTFK